MAQKILRVAIDSPLDFTLDYRWVSEIGDVGGAAPSILAASPEVGQLALVPFGRREVVGIIEKFSLENAKKQALFR